MDKRKRYRFSGLLAAALLSASCANAGTPAQESNAVVDTAIPSETVNPALDAAPRSVPVDAEIALEDAPCQFVAPVGFHAGCSWLEVPEEWEEDADSGMIRLHVAVFTNDLTPEDATPVVYLEGGPGSDTFATVEFGLADQWGPLIDNHPLIMFTQRGSAGTTIDLECEEVTTVFVRTLKTVPSTRAVELADRAAAYESCANRLLTEGADIAAYHTEASADDADAVRRSLGIARWNVLGVSYGTRLAQELVRRHPAPIESLVLDSVQPIDPMLGSLVELPATFQTSLDQLYFGCESDPACADEYPNLERRLRAVVAQADTAPIELAAVNQVSGESVELVADGSRIVDAIFQAMYFRDGFGSIPKMVAELEVGETNTLSSLMGLQITNEPFLSSGLFAAVMCHDYLADLPSTAFESALTGDALFDDVFSGLIPPCEVFPTGLAEPSIFEPVESDIDALFLSGSYDPITPPRFATAVAGGFPNGQVFVHPHAGHAVLSDSCALAVALDFLSDPNQDVDPSCLEATPPPVFVPVSLEGTAFVSFEDASRGLAGSIPEGWTQSSPGVVSRPEVNLAHQAVLIQQVFGIGLEESVERLSAQFQTDFMAMDDLTVGDQVWNVFEARPALSSLRLWIREENGLSIMVLLLSPEEDAAEVETHVVSRVLGDLRVSR